MPDLAQGVILTAAQAAPILAAAGMSRDTYVDPFGQDIEVGGRIYAILQTDIEYPGPTAWSPDGTHIVYAYSSEETAARKPEPGIMSSITTLALIGVGAYVAINLLNLWKGGKP